MFRTIFSRHKTLFVSLGAVFLYSAVIAIAAPLYNPGDTLDPTCLPSSTDCTVETDAWSGYTIPTDGTAGQVLTTDGAGNLSWETPAGGGSSQWDDVTGGINYAGGNVGIGTTTPGAFFDIRFTTSTSYTSNDYGPSLNDATFSGTYTGEVDNGFYIYIDSEGTPDTFAWYDNNGECAGGLGIPITGSAQLLCKGISVTFAATTGHLTWDTWDYNIDISVPSSAIYTSNDYGPSLNDATFSGTYTGEVDNGFYIYIDSEGTPDTFTWYDNNGECAGGASGVPITGSAQLLCNGISVTFTADTGHLNGDTWDYNIQILPTGVFTTGSDAFPDTNFFKVDAAGDITRIKNLSYSWPTYHDAGVLTNDGYGNLTWAAGSGLPDQTGNSGKYLTTNGTTASWAVLSGGDLTGLTSGTVTYLGIGAGSGITSGGYDTILGHNAGAGSTTTNGFNTFIGYEAGYANTNSANNVFIGRTTGRGVNVERSQFIGIFAGWDATGSSYSNFMGYQAGRNATNAQNSNFFGENAGYSSDNTTYSNFFGNSAGYNANTVSYSNFFGRNAGYATSSYDFASYSNFLGYNAGYGAANQAGRASYSNFLGSHAGYEALHAESSNFLGASSGYQAHTAYDSNFLGASSGYQASGAYNSNFLGEQAGSGALSAYNANFFGYQAGYQANGEVHDSNFFGYRAGYQAEGAFNSTFIGRETGYQATNAMYSNFVGSTAGYMATNAGGSVFFGGDAGSLATNAANSIFIGGSAGFNDTVDNTSNADDFSILIGNSTSTGGFENSIAIGGRAVNTASNQFTIGSTTRPITQIFVQGSGNTCTMTTGTGWSCSSDERLKTNIEDLPSDILSKLLNLQTVTYNWLSGDTTTGQVGFLAQNLETYFPELVTTDPTGYKSVYYAQMTPILVQAIRELNMKVTDISDLTKENDWRDALVAWLGDITNGIGNIFSRKITTEEICVQDTNGETCLTRAQINQLLGIPLEVQNSNTPPTDGSDEGNEETTEPTEDDNVVEQTDGDETNSDQVVSETNPPETEPSGDEGVTETPAEPASE